MRGVLNQSDRISWSTWLADELAPRRLAMSVSAGVLLYSLEAIVVVSFAALIFSGKLAGQLPAGLGWLLAGDAVVVGAVALLNSYAGSIAVEQDTSAVMMAVIAATVATRLPSGVSSTQQAATLVAVIVATTAATGIFFILLGVFKLGGLGRFMPYPVMGGFLAGTGWLLAIGGLGVMTPLTATMFQPAQLPHWLPGVLLGAVLLVATTRISHPLALPALVLGAVVLFYAIAWGAGVSHSQLSADGWLLGPFPANTSWQFPLDPTLVSHVNWSVVLEQVPAMAPVLVVSVLALLLNLTGLELVVGKDIDLDRELVATGLGNVGAGLAGGVVGYNTISFSMLNRTLSGGRRIPGLMVAALMGLTTLVGVAALGNAPRLVVGALLVYLGLDFLLEWVYRAWFRFSHLDYLIIALILAAIALRGFLAGIALGLVLTTILFIVNYSRINVIKYAVTGLTYRSRIRRNPVQQAILDGQGEQIDILALQGFIFFGTANTLFQDFRVRLGRGDLPPVHFAVLDFAHVTGLDSTGLLSFSKMRQLAEEHDVTVVLTGLRDGVRERFLQDGFVEHTNVRLFPDLDRGVEWCESQIVSAHQAAEAAPQAFTSLLESLLLEPADVTRLVEYMSRAELPAGHRLIEQGDVADTVYFIESGQVSAYLDVPGRQPVRLETMHGGRVVGELAFYLGTSRTASVVVDEPAVVYSLSREQLGQIERTDPDAAGMFHHIVAQLLADRAVHLMRTVDALQR